MSGRVLLTGGSSFTGVWIAEALAAAGFEVTAPLLRPRDGYSGVRLERVRRLEAVAEVVFETPFGSEAFRAVIDGAGPFDLLAHHAAHIQGYRDPAFDPVDALARNVAGAPGVIDLLARSGARGLILTGTVFEAGEGGDPETTAVTPYGLSKTLTRAAMEYWTRAAGLGFVNFVIPSPYGVLEEPRFGWHLFRSWFSGETPTVRTPLYVRDHLPADCLASAYVSVAQDAIAGSDGRRVARPSGWRATQGDFARRVAREAEARLRRPCPLILNETHPFEEPEVRVNADAAIPEEWDETDFWDRYVGWYERLNAEGRLV